MSIFKATRPLLTNGQQQQQNKTRKDKNWVVFFKRQKKSRFFESN
jgi:hypothetical protein